MAVQPELLERIQSDEDAEFEVVLTLTSDSVPESVESKLSEILGIDNVFAGRLTGKEVLELANDPSVASIDENTEQFALDDE